MTEKKHTCDNCGAGEQYLVIIHNVVRHCIYCNATWRDKPLDRSVNPPLKGTTPTVSPGRD